MVSCGKVKYLFKLTNNVLLVVKYTWEKRFIDVQVGLDRFWTFLEPFGVLQKPRDIMHFTMLDNMVCVYFIF